MRNFDGSLITLNPLPARTIVLRLSAISDMGLVVGESGTTSSGLFAPVLWNLNTGTTTALGPAQYNHIDCAISPGGYALWEGETFGSGAGEELYRRSPSGGVTQLDCTGGVAEWGITNSGAVLFARGETTAANYLWNPDGSITPVDLDYISAINDAGQVVGMKNDEYVILNPDGSITYLPVPDGALYSVASGINDQGVVVGWSVFSSGSEATLWQPVPEPSAFAVLACGLVGTLIQTRRRRSL